MRMNGVDGMEREKEIKQFVASLADFESPNVFNPWRDFDPRYDADASAPSVRRQNLEKYLLPRLGRAKYIVVAEAVGYQGGRFTGIAITCERMMLGLHPSVPAEAIFSGAAGRTSSSTSEYILKTTQKEKGFNEPTDTVVWGAILENGLNPYDVLLWNIFPFHPHKTEEALTNRTPTPQELEWGWPYTKRLLELNGPAKVVAVGQKAAQTMASFSVPAIALRHPANGGAGLYRAGFKEVIR